MITEEHILYEIIPQAQSLAQRREIARFAEEQMPLEHTRAYAFGRDYTWKTGHRVEVDPWHTFVYPGPCILGYRIGEELVCVDCGLQRLDPNRSTVVNLVRGGQMQRVHSTEGEVLACQDCGQQIYSPSLPPRHSRPPLGDDVREREDDDVIQDDAGR